MNVPSSAPPTQTSSSSPSPLSSFQPIDTGIPVIGTIDFSEPIEWVWTAGLVLNLFLVKGLSKFVIAAGILAARYEAQKENWFSFS